MATSSAITGFGPRRGVPKGYNRIRGKTNRIQRGIRFPPSLYQTIEKIAKEKHGGDFTAAVINLLSEGLAYLKTAERWKSEGAARDAEKMKIERETSVEEKDGTSP